MAWFGSKTMDKLTGKEEKDRASVQKATSGGGAVATPADVGENATLKARDEYDYVKQLREKGKKKLEEERAKQQ